VASKPDSASAITRTRPAMGLWMALALVMGSMIGSGVFLLPASLAPLGWNSVFGWIVTISGTLCMAGVFAALARAFPAAGGPYAYTRLAFGPVAAFAVAWAYWISLWVGNAAIATGAVSYLSRLFPVIAATPGLSAVVTVAIVWLFALINMRGAALAGRVQLVSTIIKLVPLIAVIGLAAFVIINRGTVVLRPFVASEINLAGITSAATLTLWAMLGIETATVPADKVETPEKTIPRATMIGAVATGLVYLIVCSAVVLMLPALATARSEAPFADFVDRYWGVGAGTLIAAFGAISALGALNGWVMVQAEIPAAMARDGLFPAALGKVSARGVPVSAQILSSGLLSIVVLFNYSRSMAELFGFLILLTTAIVLVMYIACAAAAARLMLQARLAASARLWTVTVVAFAYGLFTLYGAGAEALGWGAGLLLIAVPVYFLVRSTKPSQ
jgi:basic amino acid/polyamine antiporter, APA family